MTWQDDYYPGSSDYPSTGDAESDVSAWDESDPSYDDE